MVRERTRPRLLSGTYGPFRLLRLLKLHNIAARLTPSLTQKNTGSVPNEQRLVTLKILDNKGRKRRLYDWKSICRPSYFVHLEVS